MSSGLVTYMSYVAVSIIVRKVILNRKGVEKIATVSSISEFQKSKNSQLG